MLTVDTTGFNKHYAKEIPKDQWLKEHEHIDGAEEWYDKHILIEPKVEKAKVKGV